SHFGPTANTSPLAAASPPQRAAAADAAGAPPMEPLKALIRERLHASPAVAGLLEQRQELREDPDALLRALEDRGRAWSRTSSHPSSLLCRRAMRRSRPHSARGPAALERARGGSAGARWRRAVGPRGRARLAPAPAPAGGQGLPGLPGRAGRGRPRAAVARGLWRPALPRPRRACHGGPQVRRHALPDAAGRVARGPARGRRPHTGAPGAGVPRRVRHRPDPWDAGPGALVCSHSLDWRSCLAAAGPKRLTVELHGVGKRHQLSVGVLHAEVELSPAGPPEAVVAHSGVVAQLRSEEQRREEVMRRVFEELDRWWADYHDLYRSRHVRLFAQTECRLFLPVTSFVTPLEAGRAIDSPYHALRWVALLPTEPTGPADLAEPCWHTFPALWARGHCTPEEKALLLCSLLLGWSLDAWCCLGTDTKGQPHAWAVVRDQGDASTPSGVACWDPRTASRVTMDDPRYLAAYTSIDAVFNHRRLYVCHSETAARVSFDFGDARLWLAVPLDEEAVDLLRLYPMGPQPPYAALRPRLWPLPAEAEELECAIEQRISMAVQAHREAAGLPTRFDEHLAQLLHVVLSGCEAERSGSQPRASLFEAIARRECGPHEVLQAIPVQFNHLRLSYFWPALVDRPSVRELLATPPPAASFAVRARVVPFPEGVVAVWVVLAGRGRPS
ncbi:unnamed protein product, partial [Prorocentrum cordatum]